jgi:hypothetical protein
VLNNAHLHTLIEHARKRAIVQRAIKVAIVVGTILVAINYGDKIWAGTTTSRDMLKIAITYLVPYCVASYSAASALAARE